MLHAAGQVAQRIEVFGFFFGTQCAAQLGERLAVAARAADAGEGLEMVDARSGRPVWKKEVADYRAGYSLTAAPLVIGNKILVGTAGGEYGIRGFLAAFDAFGGDREAHGIGHHHGGFDQRGLDRNLIEPVDQRAVEEMARLDLAQRAAALPPPPEAVAPAAPPTDVAQRFRRWKEMKAASPRCSPSPSSPSLASRR